jgi:hypothetical protein
MVTPPRKVFIGALQILFTIRKMQEIKDLQVKIISEQNYNKLNDLLHLALVPANVYARAIITQAVCLQFSH